MAADMAVDSRHRKAPAQDIPLPGRVVEVVDASIAAAARTLLAQASGSHLVAVADNLAVAPKGRAAHSRLVVVDLLRRLRGAKREAYVVVRRMCGSQGKK